MKRTGLFELSLMTVLFVGLGCVEHGNPKNAHFAIGKVAQGWKQINAGGADLAWITPDGKAVLYANSNCDNRDTPLAALYGQLVIGFTEKVNLEETLKNSSGREALEVVMLGKLDGVKRKLKIFILKKDGCVYDVVLAAPEENFEQYVKTYDHVLEGFSVGDKP